MHQQFVSEKVVIIREVVILRCKMFTYHIIMSYNIDVAFLLYLQRSRIWKTKLYDFKQLNRVLNITTFRNTKESFRRTCYQSRYKGFFMLVFSSNAAYTKYFNFSKRFSELTADQVTQC